MQHWCSLKMHAPDEFESLENNRTKSQPTQKCQTFTSHLKEGIGLSFVQLEGRSARVVARPVKVGGGGVREVVPVVRLQLYACLVDRLDVTRRRGVENVKVQTLILLCAVVWCCLFRCLFVSLCKAVFHHL